MVTGPVLGACIWCGHSLAYDDPAVPGQGETDRYGMYQPTCVVNDYSLIDVPLAYGKFCPDAPPHPLGQFSIHELVSDPDQP